MTKKLKQKQLMGHIDDLLARVEALENRTDGHFHGFKLRFGDLEAKVEALIKPHDMVAHKVNKMTPGSKFILHEGEIILVQKEFKK